MDNCGTRISGLTENISSARVELRSPASFGRGAHQFSSLDQDFPTNDRNLTGELVRLADIGVLPSQVSHGEQTARLLLPS